MNRLPLTIAAIVATLTLAACGSQASNASKTGPTVTYTISLPAAASTTTTTPDFNRWLNTWCSVKPGTKADDAVALMGPPTSNYQGEQYTWTYRELSFTIFMRSDNTISQTQYNEIDLTAEQKAKLTCPNPWR